jgi:chemotaxis protein histidine kinase CheA
MGDSDLIEMLAKETERRTPAIIEGVQRHTEPAEPNGDGIEEIRVEAHGLKGAALVVGEKRLSELAREMEVALVQQIAPGTIDKKLADRLVKAAEAYREGVRAAANGDKEPKSVGKAIKSLG